MSNFVERVREGLSHKGFLPRKVDAEIVDGCTMLPGGMPKGTPVIHLHVQKGSWLSRSWATWPDKESDQDETIGHLAASVAESYKRYRNVGQTT